MFSKKVHYGLQFLLALSNLDPKRVLGIAVAAQKHKLPVKFLEAIAVQLKKDGIIEVKKGAGGGYRLIKKTDEVSLYDIINILEDKERNNNDEPKTTIEKVVLKVEDNLINDYTELLKSYKLSKLKKLYDSENENYMFYI